MGVVWQNLMFNDFRCGSISFLYSRCQFCSTKMATTEATTNGQILKTSWNVQTQMECGTGFSVSGKNRDAVKSC